MDSNGNGVLDAGEINQPQTKYVCNGSPATINLTGTYVGIQSTFTDQSPSGPSASSETVTFILTQSGTTISGSFSSASGTTGTISGTTNGNMFSYSVVITKSSPGCTSGSGYGLGALQNNVITLTGPIKTVCSGITYYSIYSGSGSK